MFDLFDSKPHLSNLASMLWIIVLLEYKTQIASSPQFEILESPKIVFINDFNVVQTAHDALNLVKPFHALSSDATSRHQVSGTVFDVFLDEARV